MPSKQQIMPVQVAAACETYNCYKKAAWAIGRPDGPRQLWHYHCDQCMRDIESAPEELRTHESTQTDTKSYSCDYCGEPFEKPIQKANHMRNCPKKEAKTDDQS